MATLLVVSGPHEGRYYPLEEHRLVSVGRDDQCSFQLVDEKISRRHLQIRYEDASDVHFAVDMRSANGVFVNGKRVTGELRLNEGDVVEIGCSKLMYTRENFDSAEDAQLHYRKTDEWKKGTAF